jgi:hypothetical protein
MARCRDGPELNSGNNNFYWQTLIMLPESEEISVNQCSENFSHTGPDRW